MSPWRVLFEPVLPVVYLSTDYSDYNARVPGFGTVFLYFDMTPISLPINFAAYQHDAVIR